MKRSGDMAERMAVDDVQSTMLQRSRMFRPNYAMVTIASYEGDARQEVFTGFAVVSSRTACMVSDSCLYVSKHSSSSAQALS